ncbi:DUF559 domain-containing protein [Demequina sp. NBRC 110056]|uniref:DUF559 domain-containing protein n=1 Tax=Demequina sp. NBRC 110056 TaxID=1570345 RepID=UPI0013564F1F|nr:DUF559 domain-containing protein [Demequina sp. NBRC 110056]
MRPIPGLTDLRGSPPAFLAANAHAFTRTDLMGAWSRHALDAALRRGQALRLLPGVYCAPAHAMEALVRAEGAVLWNPRTALTGAAALHLYAERLAAPATVDLVAASSDHVRPPAWIRLHQTGPLRTLASPHGIPCAVPERALLDSWRYASTGERRTVLWEALWARVCTWRELRRELDRAPRVAKRRDLERVLDWFAEGATSPLEVRAKHETFADARFREFEWQVPVALPMRRPTLDMLHRRALVAVELDGDAYHSTRSARDVDRERQTDLTAAGYTVIRFGWTDITQRPEWCRQRLLATVAGRLARLGRH